MASVVVVVGVGGFFRARFCFVKGKEKRKEREAARHPEETHHPHLGNPGEQARKRADCTDQTDTVDGTPTGLGVKSFHARGRYLHKPMEG